MNRTPAGRKVIRTAGVTIPPGGRLGSARRPASLAGPDQGVAPELVRHQVPGAVALDDVAGLDVVGQGDDLFPDGTARLLELADRPYAASLHRTQRDAGAVRTLEGVTTRDPCRDLDLPPSAGAPDLPHPRASLHQAEQAFEPPAVEPDDRFAVDDRDGRCPEPEPDQLLTRGRVLADVLEGEGDGSLRKKLFLVFAARSAGLGVDDHGLRHLDSSSHRSLDLAGSPLGYDAASLVVVHGDPLLRGLEDLQLTRLDVLNAQPGGAATRPTSWRTKSRARWSRDLTAATVSPSARAASSFVRPSTSRSTSTTR